jgi:hypothetical protein
MVTLHETGCQDNRFDYQFTLTYLQFAGFLSIFNLDRLELI